MTRLLGLAVAVAVTATGCFHYTAEIPGVLDLRSDGSTAAPNEEPMKAPPPAEPGDEPEPLRRDGVAALIEGDGVVEQGTRFTLEDRHWFLGLTAALPGLFLPFNASATPELEAALGGQALRNLRLGHELELTDVLLTAGVGAIPVVGTCATLLVAPRPWTFTASGERIRTTPAVRKPKPAEEKEPPPPPSEDAVPVPGVDMTPDADADAADGDDDAEAADAPKAGAPTGEDQ